MLTIQMDEIEMLDAINQLKKDGNKYDINLVKSEFQKPIKLYKGNWAPKNKIHNKQVLLISSGPKLNEYKKEIEKFITHKSLLLLLLILRLRSIKI